MVLVMTLFGAVVGVLTGVVGWAFFDASFAYAFLLYLGMTLCSMGVGMAIALLRRKVTRRVLPKTAQPASL